MEDNNHLTHLKKYTGYPRLTVQPVNDRFLRITYNYAKSHV